MEILTKSAEETKKFGEKIAADLKKNNQSGTVVALEGNLGSGKTTFSQGFALGLGVADRIISPTFILMKKYGLESGDFYHIDLYRLEENVEKEVQNLGLFEIWKDPKNIILIEWAERIERILPEGTIKIRFEVLDEFERKITIEKT